MPDISGNELYEKLNEIVHKANIKKAIRCEPVFTLSEILALKNITTLRKLGHLHKIPGCSRMDKQKLIPLLSAKMTNRDMLTDLLQILDKTDWELFRNVVKKKYVTDDMLFCDVYWMMLQLGVLVLFYHAGHFHYVIPLEIQGVYHILENEGFPATKEHGDLLNEYAVAAVNLYGVISLDDFLELFNSQNERKTDIFEMNEILQKHVYMENGYSIYNGYIVNDSFKDNHYRDVIGVINAVGTKPRYIPRKEQLLRFSDKDYIEEIPQLNRLRSYINANLNIDVSTAEDIIDEYYFLSRSEAELQHYVNIFVQNGVSLEIPQIDAIIELVTDLYNNSRRWSNNGHTLTELGA